MAEMAKDDDPVVKRSVPAARRVRYPWKRWANGRWWKLIEGEDYRDLQRLRMAARAWGERHGLVPEIRRDPQPVKDNRGVWITITLLRFVPEELKMVDGHE